MQRTHLHRLQEQYEKSLRQRKFHTAETLGHIVMVRERLMVLFSSQNTNDMSAVDEASRPEEYQLQKAHGAQICMDWLTDPKRVA